MSGRKSTEVNRLLARGKDARDSGNKNFRQRMESAKEILQTNQDRINGIYERIQAQTIDIGRESRIEFPQESQRIQEQFDSIKKSNVKIDYSKDIREAEKEEQSLDADLGNADKEQDSIRKRIQNKDWYCDEEYEAAGRLEKAYRRIVEGKNRLIARFTQKAQDSNQTVIKYQAMEKQMSQVVDAERALNGKTEKIIQLRQKAADSKKYVQDSFEKLNQDLAEKFLPDEFAKLRAETDLFVTLEDELVVLKVTDLAEQISIFSSRVDERYSGYLERIDKVESRIEANKDSLKSERNFYYEPVDYFKNKENATKIAVLDYLTEYSDKGTLVDQIREGIKKAQQLLDDELFDEAESQTSQNNELIEQANQYAALLQEHMIENFYVAKDMTKVMKSMGFETGAYKIDGHIKNGWKISASNPNGENIDFTKVFVDDNGKMDIQIDHKTRGDCPSKWSEICDRLGENGIFIEKVWMEDGTVVLDRRGGRKTQNPGGSGEEHIRQTMI